MFTRFFRYSCDKCKEFQLHFYYSKNIVSWHCTSSVGHSTACPGVPTGKGPRRNRIPTVATPKDKKKRKTGVSTGLGVKYIRNLLSLNSSPSKAAKTSAYQEWLRGLEITAGARQIRRARALGPISAGQPTHDDTYDINTLDSFCNAYTKLNPTAATSTTWAPNLSSSNSTSTNEPVGRIIDKYACVPATSQATVGASKPVLAADGAHLTGTVSTLMYHFLSFTYIHTKIPTDQSSRQVRLWVFC